MSLEELISLFAYYIALESAFLAYCFSQIQQWHRDALMLSIEWDEGAQASNTPEHLRQSRRLSALESATPRVLLRAPFAFAAILIVAAFVAYIVTSSSVSIYTFLVLVVLPVALLVVLWTVYNRSLITKGKECLKGLK
jgi:Flp pilus assembly protein TadB